MDSTTALAAFERDGFVMLRGFLRPPQVAALQDAVANDDEIRRRMFPKADGGDGTATELALWNDPGDDSLGALARNVRLVDLVSAALGDEVYHYHTKLNSKAPGGGGTWVWHQDYGYWYRNRCPYPDLLTVAVPLTEQTADSGSLEVLRGSHRAGRIDHVAVGTQTGADPERVEQLAALHEQVSFHAVPGDVMLFHCNLLHTSSPNRSAGPRDLLLIAYNTKSNSPPLPHRHPQYTPLDVLADDEIEARAGISLGDRRDFVGSRSTVRA